MIAFILLCVAVLVLGIAGGKPWGWVAAGLSLVSLIAAATGGHVWPLR